ncbi:hypothetical protein K443DRAFT_15712 [Laccaria amethystina LaAM-08-1]|uniref:Uncharacterized protein n=1 Tax=Laccaria amethystina LaAM-08-1 TaxID=1095629 RepID=A0A0C9WGR4_9AGAR|nr:hypothetical protein K443DRAFT_15712 [Laccaria amethystina LaAM-08-1]
MNNVTPCDVAVCIVSLTTNNHDNEQHRGQRPVHDADYNHHHRKHPQLPNNHPNHAQNDPNDIHTTTTTTTANNPSRPTTLTTHRTTPAPTTACLNHTPKIVNDSQRSETDTRDDDDGLQHLPPTHGPSQRPPTTQASPPPPKTGRTTRKRRHPPTLKTKHDGLRP